MNADGSVGISPHICQAQDNVGRAQIREDFTTENTESAGNGNRGFSPMNADGSVASASESFVCAGLAVLAARKPSAERSGCED